MTPIKPKDTNQDFARLHGPPLLPNLTCSGYFLEPVRTLQPVCTKFTHRLTDEVDGAIFV